MIIAIFQAFFLADFETLICVSDQAFGVINITQHV